MLESSRHFSSGSCNLVNRPRNMIGWRPLELRVYWPSFVALTVLPSKVNRCVSAVTSHFFQHSLSCCMRHGIHNSQKSEDDCQKKIRGLLMSWDVEKPVLTPGWGVMIKSTSLAVGAERRSWLAGWLAIRGEERDQGRSPSICLHSSVMSHFTSLIWPECRSERGMSGSRSCDLFWGACASLVLFILISEREMKRLNKLSLSCHDPLKDEKYYIHTHMLNLTHIFHITIIIISISSIVVIL